MVDFVKSDIQGPTSLFLLHPVQVQHLQLAELVCFIEVEDEQIARVIGQGEFLALHRLGGLEVDNAI